MNLFNYIKSKFSKKTVAINETKHVLNCSSQSGWLKLGTKLTVPENYICVLVARERTCDRFVSGEHVLNIENLPVLTRVTKLNVPNKNGKYKKKFFADIYFIKLGDIVAQKFCSQNGIYVSKDKDFLPVTAFVKGEYSYAVKDPILLLSALLKVYGKFGGSLAQRQIDIWTGEIADKIIEKNKPSVQKLYERDSSCFARLVEKLNSSMSDVGIEYKKVEVTQTILPKKVYQKASLTFAENFADSKPQNNVAPQNLKDGGGLQINSNQTSGKLASDVQSSGDFQIDLSQADDKSQLEPSQNSGILQLDSKKNSEQSQGDFSQRHAGELELSNSQTLAPQSNLLERKSDDSSLNSQDDSSDFQNEPFGVKSKISYKKCLKCGALNPKTSRACFKCKALFAKVCENCGAELDDSDFVCPKCKSVVI